MKLGRQFRDLFEGRSDMRRRMCGNRCFILRPEFRQATAIKKSGRVSRILPPRLVCPLPKNDQAASNG